jgi:uridine kinase
LIKKRRAAVEALRKLLATLQSEKRALDQAWNEYDAVISPDQTALVQAIGRHKERLIQLGVTNATLDDLDDTPETLRLLREFADEKEAEPAPVTSQIFSEIDRLLRDAVAQSETRS